MRLRSQCHWLRKLIIRNIILDHTPEWIVLDNSLEVDHRKVGQKNVFLTFPRYDLRNNSLNIGILGSEYKRLCP